MTEQEKLQRAKYYMDCLANGMNPFDGTSIPEQDVVNQVKISRCLFYVADVLRRQIELQEKKGGAACWKTEAAISYHERGTTAV